MAGNILQDEIRGGDREEAEEAAGRGRQQDGVLHPHGREGGSQGTMFDDLKILTSCHECKVCNLPCLLSYLASMLIQSSNCLCYQI